MTRLRRVLFSAGFPAAGAALLALTITLVVALASTDAQARPQLIPASLPRLLPLRVPPHHVKPPLFSPFTGQRVRSLKPVIAVKIDNIVDARPQTGLQAADLVYVIPVEGGLTRFMAVFSSHLPKAVGPVRSAREDDLNILRQFGRPGFAWSGAAPHLVPFIERARVVDLYANLVGGYYRTSNRVAPHNLYADPRILAREARHASKARDIRFRFGKLPVGGKAVRSYSVSYPAASYTFRWSAKAKRWLLWMDGAPAMATEGGQLGGPTVIIQYTVVRTSRFIEYGSRPPYAQSLGSGEAIVLRNGRAFHVRWSRRSPDSGTTFTLGSGKRMLFSRGQVWIVLAPKDHASFVNSAAA
jgi:hypothetical protein